VAGLSRLRAGRCLARRVAALATLVFVLAGMIGVTPVAAADPVMFGAASATSTFGKGLEFKQPVTLAARAGRVEVLLATPGSIGPEVVPSPAGAASGSSTLDYTLDLSDGHVVPNTTFTARWRVVDETGRTWLGPLVRQTYVDDRFDWRTQTGNVVRVHWYEGNQAFGTKALKIGDDAVAATAKLLGVTESDPIDFFIYAEQQAFYDALGPGTRENVGGQAHPDIRTLFALIAPDEIDAGWIESVVPHELTHVVFATAVDNPYHEPPHWLNEGLAVYLSDGYDPNWKATVRNAVDAGSIIPLDGLAGAFPTTADRFSLAYGESVSAVDRMVRVNGRDALVKLIRSYRDGVSDDDAFKSALGRDVAGFEADWLAELGAQPPTRRGPQPAPAGPLPAGWSGPQPNPSFDIVQSPGPGSPSSPRPGTTAGDSPLQIGLGLGAIVVAILLFAIGWRRMQRSPARAAAPMSESPPVSTDPPPARTYVRPAASWTVTDWSLPRDVDPPDDPQPGERGTTAEPPADQPPADPTRP
jgi:Peptidase MA superfamily